MNNLHSPYTEIPIHRASYRAGNRGGGQLCYHRTESTEELIGEVIQPETTDEAEPSE